MTCEGEGGHTVGGGGCCSWPGQHWQKPVVVVQVFEPSLTICGALLLLLVSVLVTGLFCEQVVLLAVNL